MPVHTQKVKTVAAARERSGEMAELYLHRPHSSCCRQLSLTKRLVLFSVRAKVTHSCPFIVTEHQTHLVWGILMDCMATLG